MKSIIFYLSCANIVFIVSSNSTPSPVDVASEDTNSSAVINNLKVTSLASALNFYNTELLASQWNRVSRNLTPRCRNHMGQYIIALRSGKHWALKMDDASGRYSTGWFWGNHYWTGSQGLCENIVSNKKFVETENGKDVMVRSKRSTSSTTISPSQAMGYLPGPLRENSTIPFRVSFYVLKLTLNTNLTKGGRIINFGVCLPHACTDEDARHILEETAKASDKVKVKVEAVRSRHHVFNVWQDSTFIILCIVTCLVSMLLIVGTAYDMYLQRERQKRISLHSTCIPFANNNNNVMDIAAKLDSTVMENKCARKLSYKNSENEDFAQTPSPRLESKKIPLKSKRFLVWLTKKIILAFSLKVNVKAICDQSVGSDTISVVHGLKSISMAWVILGHTCIIAFKYSDNMEYRKIVQKEFLFQTISNGAFSVDTFFFTSGLLVSFLYFRTNSKGKLDVPHMNKGIAKGLFRFLGLIVYRIARLTAPYLFVLGVVEVCMKWFNYNSIFEPPAMDHVNCPKYWWRNLLYINTLFPVEEMCMLWSWYISDDTQFYVVGAIILILASSHFKSALALLTVFMLSSWITTGYIAYSNKHVPSPDDPLALFDKIYDKPWTRLGPYLVGMCVGWILFKTDCKIRMSKLTITVGWLVSAACMVSLVYGLYEVDLSPAAGAVYSSLSHTAWALGLAWIVIACTTGYGGYVNSILSAKILYPLSRVTYCTYLIHPIIIRTMAMTMDQPLHLGKAVMITIYVGQVVSSFSLAFVVSVMFEAPTVSMLRILTKFAPTNQRNS